VLVLKETPDARSNVDFQREYSQREFVLALSAGCTQSVIFTFFSPDVAERPRIYKEVDFEWGALKRPPPREHRLVLVRKELQRPRHSVTAEFKPAGRDQDFAFVRQS
jgi:hypothetical protein